MDTARAVNSQRRLTDDAVDDISSSFISVVSSAASLVGKSPVSHSAHDDRYRR